MIVRTAPASRFVRGSGKRQAIAFQGVTPPRRGATRREASAWKRREGDKLATNIPETTAPRPDNASHRALRHFIPHRQQVAREQNETWRVQVPSALYFHRLVMRTLSRWRRRSETDARRLAIASALSTFCCSIRFWIERNAAVFGSRFRAEQFEGTNKVLGGLSSYVNLPLPPRAWSLGAQPTADRLRPNYFLLFLGIVLAATVFARVILCGTGRGFCSCCTFGVGALMILRNLSSQWR